MTLGISFTVKLIVAIFVIGVVLPQIAIFWIESIRVKRNPERAKLHIREKDE